MPIVVLDPDRVEAIFLDCLFKDGEDTSNHVVAEGLTITVGFKPERVELHRAEIEALLHELPDEFRQPGGESFLKAFEDKHGRWWTDLHQRMEQLFQLGIAIGKVEYLLPSDKWHLFPRGMPYIVVNS